MEGIFLRELPNEDQPGVYHLPGYDTDTACGYNDTYDARDAPDDAVLNCGVCIRTAKFYRSMKLPKGT